MKTLQHVNFDGVVWSLGDRVILNSVAYAHQGVPDGTEGVIGQFWAGTSYCAVQFPGGLTGYIYFSHLKLDPKVQHPYNPAPTLADEAQKEVPNPNKGFVEKDKIWEAVIACGRGNLG